MVSSAVVQPLAFTGSGYLFKLLDHNGYQAEVKRHDETMERLAAAREKWFEEETARKKKIAKLEEQKSRVNADFYNINKMFSELEQLKIEQRDSKEPVLHDFYKPSNKAKHYEELAVGILGVVSGAGVSGLMAWLL